MNYYYYLYIYLCVLQIHLLPKMFNKQHQDRVICVLKCSFKIFYR